MGEAVSAAEAIVPLEVVIEARRKVGRRPRYHRGVLLDGEMLLPERCNTDQAARGTVTLERLPDGVRPHQLCRRCWRGTQVLAAATRLVQAKAAAAHAASVGGTA